MIIRVNKTRNYTVMSNYHLRDKRLTLKAKGLLSVMLSLPEDWDYSIGGLVAICKEERSAVETALRELKENGYLVVTKIYPTSGNGGRISYIYDVYEQAQEKQSAESQGLKKQGVDFQSLENQQQINKDKLYTDKLNTDKTYTAEFDELWSIYPRKEGRKVALAAYIRARKTGTPVEAIRDGIRSYAYKVQREKTEPRYIKQGSTYFRGECWNDILEQQTGTATYDIAAAETAANTGAPEYKKDLRKRFKKVIKK